jgi:hypothetical protein
LVLPNDVYVDINKNTFDRIFRELKLQKERGVKQRVLIYVDDCAGTKAIHGNGMGAFANLSIQTPHWDVSMVVVTQQPNRVDPRYAKKGEQAGIAPVSSALEANVLLTKLKLRTVNGGLEPTTSRLTAERSAN